MSGYRILRDAAPAEAGAARYDEAYAVLERYYADLCCSDDRIYYRIDQESPQP